MSGQGAPDEATAALLPAQVVLKGFGEDHEVYAVPPEKIAELPDARA